MKEKALKDLDVHQFFKIYEDKTSRIFHAQGIATGMILEKGSPDSTLFLVFDWRNNITMNQKIVIGKARNNLKVQPIENKSPIGKLEWRFIHLLFQYKLFEK